MPSSIFNHSIFWRILGFFSFIFTVVCLSQSQFFESEFKNTKLWLRVVFLCVIIIVACGFLFKPEIIQKISENISNHCPGWLEKAFFEFCILLCVILVALLSKYPRFKVLHKQDPIISDISAYCQNLNYPDRDIKAICSTLPDEQHTKQGDLKGFYSAIGFSALTFSVSRQLKLRNEYGFFYMSLDLVLNAAMDIPVNGGSILHWKFVLISIAYCFGSIFLLGILCSFDENDKNHQPKKIVLRPEGGECWVNVESLLQGDDHHDIQSGGAGGGRERNGIGDDHNERDEHQAEMAEGDTRTVSNEDEFQWLFDQNQLHVSEEGLRRIKETRTVSNEDEEDVSNIPIPNWLHVSEMAEGEIGTVSNEDEGEIRTVSTLPISNRLYVSEEGLRRRQWKRIPRKNLDLYQTVYNEDEDVSKEGLSEMAEGVSEDSEEGLRRRNWRMRNWNIKKWFYESEMAEGETGKNVYPHDYDQETMIEGLRMRNSRTRNWKIKKWFHESEMAEGETGKNLDPHEYDQETMIDQYSTIDFDTQETMSI